MDFGSLIDVLGTTNEQITVSGIMIVLIIIETLVIRALWKDRSRREDDLDAMAKRFEVVADKYDALATKVSQRFDDLVGQMARRFFGDKE